jgi:hypothetical protein
MRTTYSSRRAASAALTRPVVALACAVAVPWLTLAPAAVGDTATAPSAAQSATGAQAAVALGSPAAASTTTYSTSTSLSASVPAAALLDQCATATVPQTERAVTFAGEMIAIPGTVRMQIRIDLQERTLGELPYRTVSAPGLGVWHSSAAGVKLFAHIQQVTNLSAPALYRGALRFRWMGTDGHLLRSEELRTARCEQPAPSPTTAGTSAAAR